MAVGWLLCVCLLAWAAPPPALAITIPPGCTYDFLNFDFTCDYRSCLPLNGADFVPPPQMLTITNIYGTFLPEHFTNFSDVNQTAFDPNFDASLTLECYSSQGTGPSSLLTFNETTFNGMDWYQNLLIKNCEIEYLIPEGFKHLGNLNFLGFEGGYINYVSKDALKGLNIAPDPNAFTKLGELSFRDVDIIIGGFKEGFMDPLENMTALTVVHSRFVILLADAWKNLHRVHTLTLDDNPFTYLPQVAFRNMSSLNVVSMENIAWQCGCGNLWFIENFETHGISLTSEAICAEPADWAGKRAQNFWESKCAEFKCDTGNLPAMNMGTFCLTFLQIAVYGITVVAFLQMLALCWLCAKTKKQLKQQMEGDEDEDYDAKGVRTMTPRFPPPRMAAPRGHAHKAQQKMDTYGGLSFA